MAHWVFLQNVIQLHLDKTTLVFQVVYQVIGKMLKIEFVKLVIKLARPVMVKAKKIVYLALQIDI
jgi:hypothetical protein